MVTCTVHEESGASGERLIVISEETGVISPTPLGLICHHQTESVPIR